MVGELAGAPRVPWVRMAFVHFAAAYVVTAVVAVAIGTSDGFSRYMGGPATVPIMLVLSTLVTLVIAGPSYIGALIAYLVRRHRAISRDTDLASVILGSVIGGIGVPLVGAVMAGFPPHLGFLLGCIPGAASAIGFAIWVAVAWRTGRGSPQAPARAPSELPLN